MIENRIEFLRYTVDPFVEVKTYCDPIEFMGAPVSASYGMGEDGYDFRLAKEVMLIAGRMVLGLSLEHFKIPHNMRARCDDKSTNLRMGLRVAGRAAPGWHGYLTLELVYVPIEGGPSTLILPAGWAIAVMEYGILTSEASYPSDAKYQGSKTIQRAI